MSESTLTIAVIQDLFAGDDGAERLHRRLRVARGAGAQLALLPELPLDPWVPAQRKVREADAEPPGGPRAKLLAAAARNAGLGLLGGAIVREPGSSRRFNRALLFDSEGELVAGYDKLHLPSEEGFWESDHYGPGDHAAQPIDGFGMQLGIQICSDLNRPEGSHLLGALGAEVIISPRATPPSSYARWLLVARANAITSATYVISINRATEPGLPIGGGSFVVAPDGEVLLESADPLNVIELKRQAVLDARRDYPGYIDVRSELYAEAWSKVPR
jgi:predicted amidohydrolase